MRETVPLEGKNGDGAEIIISDFRQEFKHMTDMELIDLLDTLRVAERKPEDAESLDEKLVIAEARRRAYLLNEAADETEKIMANKDRGVKQAA